MNRKSLGLLNVTATQRGLTPNLALMGTILFHNGDRNQKIEVISKSHSDSSKILLTYYKNDPRPNIARTINDPRTGLTTRLGEECWSAEAYRNNQLTDKLYFVPMDSDFIVHPEKQSHDDIPIATFVSKATSFSPQEIAAAFTEVVKERRRGELIRAMKIVNPDITNIEIMHYGTEPVIHAALSSENLIPINALGEGARLLFLAALHVCLKAGGVLLIDEIDGSFHFSKLREIWSGLFSLCCKYDWQIIAVTHSRESVMSAFAAAGDIEKEQDFCYMRLERDGENLLQTLYDNDDLGLSEKNEWEIR